MKQQLDESESTNLDDDAIRINNYRNRIMRNRRSKNVDHAMADKADAEEQKRDITDTVAASRLTTSVIDDMFTDAIESAVTAKQDAFVSDVRSLIVTLLGLSQKDTIETFQILKDIGAGNWPKEIRAQEMKLMKERFANMIAATAKP